jgi:hypothetical protein
VGGGFMESDPDWSGISDALLRVLPKPVRKRRCKLLPQILQEWSRTDLKEHLSLESRAITQRRIKSMEIVKRRARKLQEALDAIESDGRAALVAQMMIAEGRRLNDVGRANFAGQIARLNEESDFLGKLAAIAPKEFWNLTRGQPRKVCAYLVLKDAAALFEWLSGIKATREVSRDDGTETGPFFHFASILWPTIFRNGVVGLPAAMKNWAQLRRTHDEQSALVVNMALRHRSWGIFAC